MTGAWHGGKGSDTRPEAVPGSFGRNFPVDMDARGREERGCKGQFALLTSNPPQPSVVGCTCGRCEHRQ